MRATRERCIEHCAEMNLPITLAMTVTPENLPFLWDAIEFGLRWPHVRGISFQPMFTSGRVPQDLLPLPARNERGEGQSDKNAPPLPRPLPHPIEVEGQN